MSESMQEMMEREKAEAIRNLNLANSALSRLFGIEEEYVDCGRSLLECEADDADCEQMNG